MAKLLETAIVLIDELAQIRNHQYLQLVESGNIKESTQLKFKISSYKKWITIIKSIIDTNPKLTISSKDDIKKLNIPSDKLELKLIELFEKGYIDDIVEARKLQIDKKNISRPSTATTATTTTTATTASTAKETASKKECTPLDTSLIESQPKILNGEVRPKSIRGGCIFDLRYIHGIGEKTAEKIYDKGATLEGLLNEWKTWTAKNPNNAILNPIQMDKPDSYSKKEWDSMDKTKRYELQEANLKKRLDTETKQLCIIHKSSLVGLKHFHDMSKKIPRDEIQRAEKILTKMASHMSKEMKVALCGSYRRGRDKSGDIDCLLIHSSLKTAEDLETSKVNVLSCFVELLTNANFIVDHLEMGSKKFMGFCKVPNLEKKTGTGTEEPTQTPIARRIDIRLVPYDSYGAALLYFTGSKTFNTQMRTHALNKGYKLNEFGLTSVKDGTFTQYFNEEEIFKKLNYPYKTPPERDI